MISVRQQQKIEIPYGTGDEVLELEVANLPAPHETVGILTEQNCKIAYWIALALEYYKQRNFDAFELLLTTCLSHWDLEKIRREVVDHPSLEEDRVKALDLLGVYYVRKALQESKNREAKRDYSTRAAQKINEVDRAGVSNQFGSVYQTHLMCRAYHCMMIEGRNEQAEQTFSFVLSHQQQSGESENVAPLLGKACIEFNKKEASGKRNALNLYKKALQLCPNCPADVRLGLGICFYKLNMFEKAEIAFRRAIALDPQCVGAITGLAVIELNKKNLDSIKRGIEYLSRAFKIEPSNSMVLTLLADHFFYSHEHEKVIKLATRALEGTENEAMQAQACYQLGRAYHKRKEYDNAFEYYYKATQFGASQSFLAYYGLGQMYIHRGEFDSAIQAFETVLNTHPENIETLKVLASLYARSNSQSKKDQAKSYLKKVTTTRPDDIESWVELASLCEQHDTQAAMTAYTECIKLYEAKSQPVPPEIYNNMACLLFSTEELGKAEEYFELSKKRCEEEEPSNRVHYECIKFTIEYNIGRLLEANHELIKAEEIYKRILIEHPMYVDCYLRLGCMARDRGLFYDASDKFKEIIAGSDDDAAWTSWTLLGNMHFSKNELTPSQKKFEIILKKCPPSSPDIYSLIAIGNVWLQHQYMTHRMDKVKTQEYRRKAIQFYGSALKYDTRNIYAVNGLGCIFAAKVMLNEARDIFSQVREATADFPDVWINIAHIYVEQRQYAAAVQMYENCLKKFYNNSNSEILLYIARAHFKANKLLECKKALLKARHICPHDLVILINLAKVLKTFARQVFEDRKSTYLQVVAAEYELRLARQYFQKYVPLKDKVKCVNDRSLIDSTIVGVEEQDCADLLLQVEKSIKVDAEQRDREEALRRQQHEEQLRLELRRKAEEEEKRIKEEQMKKDELENKRRELLKRQEEAKLKLLEESHSGIVNDDGSDDGTKRKKQKTKKRERPEKDREGDRQDKERPSENKKYKSRAILSSESSSDSSDDEGIL